MGAIKVQRCVAWGSAGMPREQQHKRVSVWCRSVFGAGVKVAAEVCSQAVLNCRCFAALSTFGRCFVEKGQKPLSREGDKHRNKLKVWANAGVWLKGIRSHFYACETKLS